MTDILKRNNVNVSGDMEPTILYAHGFGCNQDMWNGILPGFSDTHRQVVFDYVGSGKSDLSSWTPERYSELGGYADDIIEVCEALDITKDVIFVGHSVSASIGLLASIKRPELFKNHVFVGPTPCFLNHPPSYMGGFDREDLEGLLDLMDKNYLGWASYLAPVVSGEEGSSNTSTQLQDSFCTTDPKIAKVFANATFFADNRDDLVKATTPSLILQHARDALVPIEIGEFLNENLANSQLKVLDVAGHCAHMSHPALVIDAMKEYLYEAA